MAAPHISKVKFNFTYSNFGAWGKEGTLGKFELSVEIEWLKSGCSHCYYPFVAKRKMTFALEVDKLRWPAQEKQDYPEALE